MQRGGVVLGGKVQQGESEKLINNTLGAVYEQREEIVRAFLAKYNGLQPDDVEQVITTEGDKIIWTVRKKIS